MKHVGLSALLRLLLCLSLCGCLPNTRMVGDRGVFYTRQDQQSAEQARAIFASFRPGNGQPSAVYNPANRTAANSQKATLRSVVQSLRGKQSLTSAQHDQLVQALSPFTNYANLATSQNQGGIPIPAGGAVRLTLRGYCLDPGIPAPGLGEQFRLVPISTVLPPELLPIYQAVIAHDLRRADISSNTEFAAALSSPELMKLVQWLPYQNIPRSQQDTQGTLWFLRNVALNNLNATFSNVIEAQLEYSYPGALNIIQSYGNRRNSSLSAIFSSPVDTASAMNAMRQAATQAPPSNLGYTEIQPGVVAHGYATSAGLTPTIDIVNTTSAPAGFNLTDWIAQAPRPVQRVALPANPTSISYTGPQPSMTPVQRAALVEVLGILGDVAAQFTPAAPIVDVMLTAAALQQLNSWMAANQQSGDSAKGQPVTVTPTGSNSAAAGAPEPDDQNSGRSGKNQSNVGEPDEGNLLKVSSNSRADKIAQDYGYKDAHDAKDGYGGSRVDIYTDKATGRAYMWDGIRGSHKEPL